MIAVKLQEATRKMSKQRPFLLFLFPGLLFFAIFSYLPLYGLIGAFQEYDPIKGFWGSHFIGLENFKLLFSFPDFAKMVWNTIYLGVIILIFGFPAPILLALILNEIISQGFKRIVQSVSYLPHFISWVIAAGIWYEMLSANGPLNNMMIHFKLLQEPIYFFNEKSWFYSIAVVTSLWKEIGYASIIYLAALSSISPALYETAQIDGASKMQQIRYITLPSLAPTIALLFVLAVSNILNVSFDQMWVLQNPANTDVSEILDTYIFRILQTGTYLDYSLGIAIGLIKAAVAITIFFITNGILKKLGFGSLI